jgi:DNA-binding MarR family transcriptional regulator
MEKQLIPEEWRSSSPAQRDSLVTLAHQGKSTASAIARGLGVEPEYYTGNILNALRNLEERELVESENADDVPGRSRYWQITDEGRALLHGAHIEVNK